MLFDMFSFVVEEIKYVYLLKYCIFVQFCVSFSVFVLGPFILRSSQGQILYSVPHHINLKLLKLKFRMYKI